MTTFFQFWRSQPKVMPPAFYLQKHGIQDTVHSTTVENICNNTDMLNIPFIIDCINCINFFRLPFVLAMYCSVVNWDFEIAINCLNVTLF